MPLLLQGGFGGSSGFPSSLLPGLFQGTFMLPSSVLSLLPAQPQLKLQLGLLQRPIPSLCREGLLRTTQVTPSSLVQGISHLFFPLEDSSLLPQHQGLLLRFLQACQLALGTFQLLFATCELRSKLHSTLIIRLLVLQHLLKAAAKHSNLCPSLFQLSFQCQFPGPIRTHGVRRGHSGGALQW